MKKVTGNNLKLLSPNIRQVYVDAFADVDAVLARYEVNTSALRIAHFMAQILHESGGLTIFEENLNYSANRMMVVWPTRFPALADALPFAHNPKKLANKVYNGRMGNASGSNDGWNFRGRGPIQITGKEGYREFGTRLGIDLVATPELAISAAWCLPIACEEWKRKGCNKLADEDKLTAITKKISGGTIGLQSRKDWLRKTKNIWS